MNGAIERLSMKQAMKSGSMSGVSAQGIKPAMPGLRNKRRKWKSNPKGRPMVQQYL